MPYVGEDIKVMGLRYNNKIDITLAIAFVASQLKDINDYIEAKEHVKEYVLNIAKKFTNKEINIKINTGDDIEKGEVYITKSGLSCESGDDGQVGRGNRINGLITPFRKMSLEAAAGKNPVSHVGKIYNILANEIAKDVIKNYNEIKECNVALVSQIGKRIDEPAHTNVGIVVNDGNFENLKSKVHYIVDSWLERLNELTLDIAVGKYKVF